MKKIFNILIIITLFLSMNLSVSSCAIAPEVTTEETEVITTEEEVTEETTEETTEEETTEVTEEETTEVTEEETSEVSKKETAYVIRVIDGDTIEVDINGKAYKVRYIGINTPEYNQPFGDEATQTNSSLVLGKTVILEKDVSETDK
ncbi:unnamed protein product, partial [marine sediment metagenome]